MPSTSKSQQRLMGLSYAYKTGKLKKLNPKYAKKVKTMAKSMSAKQLKDFATTKHKNLPEYKESFIMTFEEFNESKED